MFPLEYRLGGHKHRYPLNVSRLNESRLASCVIFAVETLVTSVLRKKKNENENERKKRNTESSNTRKFASKLIIVIILFKGDNFEKSICNSPSSHGSKN